MAFGCKSGQICFYMGATSVLICALAFSKLTAGDENDQTEPEKGPEKEQTDPVIGADYSWTYPEEANGGWSRHYDNCEGMQQSPISYEAVESNCMRESNMIFNKYNISPTTMTLFNEGDKLELSGQWASSDLTPSVSFLNDIYTFEYVYFHWGTNETPGTEHILVGKTASMEMQVVHRSPEGEVLIIGLLLWECENNIDVPGMSNIKEGLKDVIEDQASTNIKNTALQDIVPISKIWNNFYWYTGSLTTPPCTESVNWCLGADLYCINIDKIDSFRKVKSKSRGKMSGNIRGVKELNGRRVYHICSDSNCISERKGTLILYLTWSLTLLIVAT